MTNPSEYFGDAGGDPERLGLSRSLGSTSLWPEYHPLASRFIESGSVPDQRDIARPWARV